MGNCEKAGTYSSSTPTRNWRLTEGHEQGETYYKDAQPLLQSTTTTATKGLEDLMNRTRSLSESIQQPVTEGAESSSSTTKDAPSVEKHPDAPESLPADILKEAEGMLSRFKLEASKRLKTIEKAEDAADEALLKFGSGLKNFLRDAVTISAPEEGAEGEDKDKVLFESKDAEGKRVVHATRFDASLHVIHCNMDSFLEDPASDQYKGWVEGFDAQKRTDEIAKDLDKYEELRKAMEKLVPERVDYATFWQRYYFLRHVIETEEQRRRELLKGKIRTAEKMGSIYAKQL